MKGKLGLVYMLLIGGALIGAFAVTAIYFGNKGLVTFVLGVIAAFSILAGSVLGLSTLLDKTIVNVAEALEDGMGDDVGNLKKGHITWPIWQGILTIVSAIVYVLLILRYHKVEALWWGSVPVWIMTILAACLLGWLVTRTSWFKDQDFETPAYVYIIAVAGFALALILGISQTEDTRLLDPGYGASAEEYNIFQTNYYIFGNESGGSGYADIDFDLPECSGDSCDGYAYLLLFIVFVILVLILIIGSAFIANFWVFAGGLFVVMMILLTVQALMYSPYSRRRYSY